MREINLSKQSIKFISNLPHKQRQQISKALISLQNNPMPQDAKKLHGYNYYRIDCGEYRVVYIATDVSIDVFLIGKRNDDGVYRKLQRS